MSAEIHRLHSSPPVGHFLRIGHTGHRILESFYASGRLAIDRVVFDAAHISKQKELLDSLRSSNTEIILDTQVAELSTPGGYLKSARNLPWAHSSRPYAVDDFNREQIFDLAVRIADFAVEYHVNVVLAPTHLITGPSDAWFAIDIETCQALRTELDTRGGNSVSIDYPLLTTYQVMLDGAARKVFASRLTYLPFDCLWLRIANFGSDKSAAGLRKYINATRDFHCIDKPIVSDGIGGLPALGVVAFGASGGFCHGVAEKERFYPDSWRYPKKSGSGGGIPKRVYFPGLDTYLNVEQAKSLLQTRGAKPLLGCRNTVCCPAGWEDMILKPKAHYLTQTTGRVMELSEVPEMRRPSHFLSQQLAPADRIARKALGLKVTDPKIRAKLLASNRRTDDMRRVLEELQVTNHNLSRAGIPANRAKRSGPKTITLG